MSSSRLPRAPELVDALSHRRRSSHDPPATSSEPSDIGGDAITRFMLAHAPEKKVSRRGGADATAQFHHTSRIFEPPPSESPHRRAGPLPRPIDDPQILPKIAPPRLEDIRKDEAIERLSHAPTIVEKMLIAHAEQAVLEGAILGAGYHAPHPEQSLWSGRKLLHVQPPFTDHPTFLPEAAEGSERRREGVKKRPENYDAYQVEGMKLRDTFKVDGKLSSNRLLFNPLTGETTSMMMMGGSNNNNNNSASSPSPPSKLNISSTTRAHIYSHRFSAELPTAPAEGQVLFSNPLTGQVVEYRTTHAREGGGGEGGHEQQSGSPSGVGQGGPGQGRTSAKKCNFPLAASRDHQPGAGTSGYAPYGRFDQPVTATYQPLRCYGPV
jgi:hypothetical protein